MGATGERDDEPLPTALGAASAGDSLRLLIFGPREPITRADSVHVSIVFRAGTTAERFHYNSELLEFEAWGPEGDSLTIDRIYALNAGWGVDVPPFGFWGTQEVIACPAPAEEWQPPFCSWQIPLTRPGVYRLVAHYATVPPPGVQTPIAGRDHLRLVSDTAHLRYAPE